jgi:Outer membrane protein
MRRLKMLPCLLPLFLSGCATSSLEMAPQRPDRPWQPVTDAAGEIQSDPASTPASSSGYTLPANRALAQLPAALSSIDAGHAYSLAELIDIAQSNNPSTRIAWEEARAAALAAGIARSAYLPDIAATIAGGYQASHHSNSALGLSAKSDDNVKGSISAVSLQWLLFDFGKRDAVVDAAKQASVISNIAFTAAHQQVIYKVCLAYYGKAAADVRLETARQAVKNTAEIDAAAKARLQHGVGTVMETADAAQALAQARLDLIASESQAEESYMALLSAMGVSALTKLKTAIPARRALSSAMNAPIEQFVREALARRPDMLSAHAARNASLANLRAAKAEFLPKLFLSTTGSYTEGGIDVTALPGVAQSPPTVNLSGSKLGATVFLGLRIPIYDGGVREAMLQQAHSNIGKSDALIAQIRDEAVRQIVSAASAAKTSLSAFDAAQSLVSASATSYEASLAAYKHGVGSITAVTTAQNQLLRAKYAEAESYSTALSAAATLALASGALGKSPDELE